MPARDAPQHHPEMPISIPGGERPAAAPTNSLNPALAWTLTENDAANRVEIVLVYPDATPSPADLVVSGCTWTAGGIITLGTPQPAGSIRKGNTIQDAGSAFAGTETVTALTTDSGGRILTVTASAVSGGAVSSPTSLTFTRNVIDARLLQIHITQSWEGVAGQNKSTLRNRLQIWTTDGLVNFDLNGDQTDNMDLSTLTPVVDTPIDLPIDKILSSLQVARA